MFSFTRFIHAQEICTNMAREMHIHMYKELRGSPAISMISVPNSHCFRITFTPTQNPYGVTAISCSIPSDANYELVEASLVGREPDYIYYETALIGTDDSLTYSDELGYSDICRFESVREVIEEVLRIYDELVSASASVEASSTEL